MTCDTKKRLEEARKRSQISSKVFEKNREEKVVLAVNSANNENPVSVDEARKELSDCD